MVFNIAELIKNYNDAENSALPSQENIRIY